MTLPSSPLCPRLHCAGTACNDADSDGADLPDAGDRYELRLADLLPMSEAKDRFKGRGHGDTTLHEWESFVQLDITDFAAFRAACDGMHTVVHLAATVRTPH